MEDIDSLWTTGLLRRFLGWLRHYRAAFFSSLTCGLLAHMFAFTNKLINHDEAGCLFSKGATVSSGRWGLGALDSILPNFSMPWIYGILTIVLIALAVCLMADLFHIRSRLLQALLGGCVLAFPSLTGTFGYMFTSSSYGVAFLLAVLGVWLVCKGRLWAVAGLAAVVLSLSIYQAYIAITATLLVLVLIQDLLQGKQVLPVFKRGLFFLGFLIVTLGLYILATALVLNLTHTQMNSYAGGNVTFQLSALPQRILLAYQEFFRSFTQGAYGLMPGTHRLHLLLAAVSLGLLGCWLWTGKHHPGSIVLLLVLVALLPLSINCMFLFTAEGSIHTLVLYSFLGFYLFSTVLIQEVLPEKAPIAVTAKVLKNAGIWVMALVIAGNILLANQAYLQLFLRYENAFSFYSNVLAAAQQTPGFQPGCKIAVVGNWQAPGYEAHFEPLDAVMGVKGFIPNDYSAPQFFWNYLGVSLPFADEAQVEALRQTDQFRQMPIYPYHGSIQCIGDYLVIKLSE